MLKPISTTAAVQAHMQFNLLGEGPIDLSHAATCFADGRGRKPHIATLRRWAKTGCRGVKLETVYLGGRLMTSRPAIARFLAAINGGIAATPTETPSAAERAGQELDDLLK